VLLAWWVVPITMFLFWGRYLPRHDRIGTTFHVTLLVISLTAALRLYQLAVATLRGDEREPFRWKGMLANRRGYQTAAFVVVVGMLFGVVSWGARWGVPSNAPILGVPLRLQRGEEERQWQWRGTGPTGPRTWVPRLMGVVGYSPFANLAGADVSQKTSAWSESHQDINGVTGAQLQGANLRYALASEVFLVGARLSGADLSGAVLIKARLFLASLRSANLSGANLIGADLSGADVRSADLHATLLMGANLCGADLDMVKLEGAALTHSDFRKARNLDLAGIKGAQDWKDAFYDDEALKTLGLPSDNNSRIAEQRTREKEPPPKQNAGQTLPKQTSPKQN